MKHFAFIYCLLALLTSCSAKATSEGNQNADSASTALSAFPSEVSISAKAKDFHSLASKDVAIDDYYTLVKHEKDLSEKLTEGKETLAKYEKYFEGLKKQVAEDEKSLEDLKSKKSLSAEDSLQIKKLNKSLKENKGKQEKFLANKEKLAEWEKEIQQTKKEIQEAKPDYVKASKELQSASQDLYGEFTFSYKGLKYMGFVAHLDSHDIRTHLGNPALKGSPNYKNLGNLKTKLEKDSLEVLMLTNAGMYTPSLQPEGLLISEGEEVTPIDLGGPQPLNFYLMPNGVFYLANDSAFVKETHAFNDAYEAKSISPEVATQSGPLLVINGEHHPRFNHGSPNLNLRSGVGIIDGKKLVFIISEGHDTNLFDFATIFKDLFGCQNALFLDGAISRMYLKETNPKEMGGNFGPLLSITKK